MCWSALLHLYTQGLRAQGHSCFQHMKFPIDKASVCATVCSSMQSSETRHLLTGNDEGKYFAVNHTIIWVCAGGRCFGRC